MPFKLLNGAASPANWARKIPGPLMVLIVPSTPPSIHDELLRRAFFRRIRSQEQRHVRDVIGQHPRQSGDRSLGHVVNREARMLEPPNNGTKIDDGASA